MPANSITTQQKTSGVHVFLVLWKAHDALRQRSRQSIARLGLDLTSFAVLEALLHKGPLPVNTIGIKVDLTSGSISVAVDRLQRRGLVTRKDDPGDRRARIVHLTRRGRTLIRCAFGKHAAAMERAVSGVSKTERAQLVRLLKKLGSRATETPQEG